jgi:hypothetical protein
MATLAEMLRQGADKLINLPSEAQRFVTNPQAFTQLLTGKNPLPRETGFAAGATGLPPTEMSVLDPNQAPYMQGYSQGEPIGYAAMALPLAAPAAVATAKALAPKAGQMAENYMVRQNMIQPITAYHGSPHEFTKFDLEKVGTGRGVNALGKGVYATDTQEFAQNFGKNVYKIDLPDEKIAQMINFDAPLSQQPKIVTDFIKKYEEELADDLKKYGVSIKTGKTPNIYDNYKGGDLFMFVSEKFGDGAKATPFLQEAGIQGIIKKDKSGKNNANIYSIFDPSDVTILEQNNKPLARKELIQQQIDKIE